MWVWVPVAIFRLPVEKRSLSCFFSAKKQAGTVFSLDFQVFRVKKSGGKKGGKLKGGGRAGGELLSESHT